MSSNPQSDLGLKYDLLRELYRRDFPLFAQEQLVITGVEPGQFLHLHPFTTPQEILHQVAEEQRAKYGWVRIVFIKARQFGSSTYTVGLAYWLAALNAGVETLHIAQDDDTAAAIFRKCKMFYDRMDPNLRPLSRFDNKKLLRFENPDQKTRSRYPGLSSQMRIAHAKNILAGTGTTQHFLHLSEAAKYQSEVCNLLESSMMPALHLKPGTVCINESTAFRGGDYFRSCCDRAMSERSEWRFIFVPWYLDKRYFLPLEKGERIQLDDEERRIKKIAKTGQTYGSFHVPKLEITPEQFKWRRFVILGREDGELIFKQEYPTTYEEAWITLDCNVFRRDKLYEMREQLKPPKRFGTITPDGRVLDDKNARLGEEEEYFAIFEEPLEGERYDIGVDTSAGLEEGDFCVAEVWKRSNREQVAEFRVRLDAVELGEKIYWLGHFYKLAQISLEMANTGFAVNACLQRLGYPYLYIWRHRERSFPTLSTYTGWKTTRESKSYMISLMTSWVNHDQLIVRSHVLWNEMSDYIRIPGASEGYDQYRGDRGYDDCVMAAGIGLVAQDDETFGRHAPQGNSGLSRKEQIELAIKDGGAAYRDDRDPGEKKGSGILQSQKNWSKGWD